MSKKKQYCYDFPRPALTADCILFRRKGSDLELLLIQRAFEPFKGNWALPGGFVDMDETTYEAAVRELAEETGIQCKELKQLYTFSELGRDPRGKTVSVVYYAFMNANIEANAGDDAAEANWFSINNLPDLAFDHLKIIEFAIKKLDIH